jgi:hypothetical protein
MLRLISVGSTEIILKELDITGILIVRLLLPRVRLVYIGHLLGTLVVLTDLHF